MEMVSLETKYRQQVLSVPKKYFVAVPTVNYVSHSFTHMKLWTFSIQTF